jgi:hypothetical protein
MAKSILNLLGALLIAALTAATTSARAQEIVTGTICEKKVAGGSQHQCGYVNGTGSVYFTNIGIHEVLVYSSVRPGGPEVGRVTLEPNASSFFDVSPQMWFYIQRVDLLLSDRTLAIKFTAVPTNSGLGAAPPASDASMFIELNATTEDVGIRASLDGEPWKGGQIIGPDHHRIFQVSGVGNLGEVGLTELSFATHEPARGDLSLDGLLALFPVGEYEFRGRTVEGERLLGTATLTHDIPDGPLILTPEEGAVVDPEDAVISWDPVTEPAGIEIAGYRVIVERGDRDRTLSLELPPETTSVPVPPDFLEPGTDYLLQVLAIEVSGNRTIAEGTFTTGDVDETAVDDIKTGDVCEKKVAPWSYHLCGLVPADGQVTYTNNGPHVLTVCTTKSGLNPEETCEQFQNVQPNEQMVIAVSEGLLFWILRHDNQLSYRTLSIQFNAVP